MWRRTFKFFRGCFPQILLRPFLNTLTHFQWSQVFTNSGQLRKTSFWSVTSIQQLNSLATFRVRLLHHNQLHKIQTWKLWSISSKYADNLKGCVFSKLFRCIVFCTSYRTSLVLLCNSSDLYTLQNVCIILIQKIRKARDFYWPGRESTYDMKSLSRTTERKRSTSQNILLCCYNYSAILFLFNEIIYIVGRKRFAKLKFLLIEICFHFKVESK